MATYNLGRILPVFKGAFNSEESYNRLDVVYVSSYGSYVCNTDKTTTSPVDDSENWVLLNRDISNAQAWEEFVQAEAQRDTIVNNLVTNGQSQIDDFLEDATIRVNNTISGAEGEMVQIGQEWDTLKGEMEQYGGDVSEIQRDLNTHTSNTDIHVTAADKARWDAGSGSDFSGSYNDLTDKPTIPTKTSDLTNDSNFVVGSTLATVATTGSYNDLTDKPTISTVNDATITITQGGTTKGTFTLNQSSNATIDIDAGGGSTRDTWYGSQAQFDAIPENQLDENTDYYISGNVQWDEIAGKPIIPTRVSQLENDSEYTTISTVRKEVFKGLKLFEEHIQYVTQSEYDSMEQAGTLKPDVTYFIQDSTDNTIQMDVVFSDNTTATYNVYINN